MNTIKVVGMKSLVPVSQIMYILGRRNYSEIHTVDGKFTLSSMTLKAFEEQSSDLIRIHKGTLVNPAFIRKVTLAEPGEQCLLAPITMRNGTKLVVARRRCELLLSIKKPGYHI